MLTRLLRPVLRRLRREDEGAALASVVALVVISGIVCVAISSSVFAGNGITTANRASVQAKAAAEAGIDWAYGQLASGVYPCSRDAKSQDPSYIVSLNYTANGSALPCAGGFVSGSPTAAAVTSTGYAQRGGTTTSASDSYVMGATASVTVASSTTTTTGGTVSLDKAIFSANGSSHTNNTGLAESAPGAHDAHVYSNGSVSCATQITIDGIIYAQGSISLSNNCRPTGTVWAGGNITLGDNSTYGGDIFAAGTGQLDLRTSHVEGNVLVNGSITGSNGGTSACGNGGSWKVCGSMVALGGGITLQNGANVKGSAYARDGVVFNTPNSVTVVGANVVSITGGLTGSNLGSGKKVTGNVKVKTSVGFASSYVTDVAGSCAGTPGNGFAACKTSLTWPALSPAATLPSTLGYPSTGTPVIAKPPREDMPRIDSAASDIAKWTSQGWTRVDAGSCAAVTSFLNGTTWAAKTVLVVSNCAPLSWNNATLTLRGDLAIINAGGFSNSNNLTIKSSTSAVRSLSLIVPSDAPGVSWSNGVPTCSPARNIGLNNISVSNVKVLLYTPCALTMSNQASGFRGQLYGGTVSTPNNSTLTMAQVAIPGVTSSTAGSTGGSSTTVTTPASATLLSRFDVG